MNDIRLDWDNITIGEARRRITAIMDYVITDQVSLWQSSTSGYHVLVKTSKGITQDQSYHYRKAWKDDGRRLVLDILFRGDKPRDILFTRKKIGGLTWHRTFIAQYTK